MQKFYVDADGRPLDSIVDGAEDDVPPGYIEVPYGPPENADQIWQFPEGPYGPSRSAAAKAEVDWQESELAVISRQLQALEEADAAAEEGEPPPEGLLPGTRNRWLSYRTKVSAWKDANPAFPFGVRPARPT